jgi:predicted ester cyclase
LVLTILLAISPSLGWAAPDAPAAALERNKAVAMRVFNEILNQGHFAVADEIYAPDFVNHGLHRNVSLHEDQAAARAEVKAFPDLRMTVDLVVAEGDFVTVMWTFRGTHTAFGYGLPPTGSRVELRGMTIWRVVDGKLHDEWTSFNALAAYLQVLRHLKWFLSGLLLAVAALIWFIARRLGKRSAAS